VRITVPFWRRASDEERERAEEQKRRDAARAAQARADQAEAQRRQGEDLKRLASGGIPGMAVKRLDMLRGGIAAGGSFNSDLSPSETALLHHGGYWPLGLVGGSAVYHVGTQSGFAARDRELVETSRAYNHAAELAVGRMAGEAGELRANGVVGVRFSFTRHEWSENCVEVQIIGTAVRTAKAPKGGIWLSDLPGQEWWALHQAGYEAVGLVHGHCVWFAPESDADERAEQSGENRELKHLRNALKQSRTIVDRRIQETARKLKAHGVVGVHLSRRVEEFELENESDRAASSRKHHILILSVIGTAVRFAPRFDTVPARPRLVVSLRGGTLEPSASVTVPAAVLE
jgi:uncharacterized protein YbjQ (UPF0145 family)